MSGFTKEIIIRTLFELLNEKPLAKITVKDIVERCGVNRNTFYYHFRDISDVVESALLREVDNAFEHPVEVDSMLECLEVLVKLIGENKKAMLHIYCSVQRETFTSALDKMCQYVIKQYIVHNFKEEIMEKEDMKVLMHFYKCVMIGVILDWVPGGFCANAEGLATFNGRMLFEREIHPNWGTHKFDFSRPEVRSFLVSNALFWIEEFHVDGIRMDGVSSMLYLNFGVDNPADKKFNKYGTEEDLDASAFIRQVNCAVGKEYPDVMMIAEESTAWPLVTYPAEDGGLGFHLKWDMGWMNDTLHYMQCDFPWRPGNHSLLTFSIMYAFSENFVLPLSHDEVVNGKCSLIGRMPGDDWRRFAGLRTLAFYQMTHPGAKLSFMGDEIGQQIEWRYYESIEWFLAKDFDATHGAQQRFIEALNHFYTKQRGLWQNAYTEQGFEWIDANNSEQSIVSFVRHGDKPADDLLILINFDPASYETYRVGTPREGDWELVFNTDEPTFGGSGFPVVDMASSKPEPWNMRDNSIEIAVPGLAGLVYRRRRASSYKPPKAETPKTKAASKTRTSRAK